MKVLVAHNAYLQRGGEDAVVEAETTLLRAHGHEVVDYRRDNAELAAVGAVRAAAETLWSRRSAAEVARLLQTHRPDVVHVHNTFPRISPSLHWAAAEAGVPLVQTWHNFRLLCPQAMLLREGRVCEDCVGRTPWPALRHACYRGSRAQTGVLAGMLVLHRVLGTWQDKVARHVVLNEFCRDKFVAAGLPAGRVVVKPNFVAAPAEAPDAGARQGLLFVGRLAPEKGIALLVEAARAGLPAPLTVLGDGPEAGRLRGVAGIDWRGRQPPPQVYATMQRAAALVVPSLWPETFGLVVIEAFANGLPVIASRIGALPELVEHGRTGLLFTPGDTQALRHTLRAALADPAALARMGAAARRVYEQRYTPERGLANLLRVYAEAGAKG